MSDLDTCNNTPSHKAFVDNFQAPLLLFTITNSVEG